MRKSVRMATLALVGGLSHVSPAVAATVFSNYNNSDCKCGFGGPEFVAEGFTPNAEFDFIGAGAFVQNGNNSGDTETVSIALYSSTARGAPAANLWTSGTVNVPGPQNQADFVQEAYNGPPIPLHIGTEYFLVVELPDLNVAWLNDGSSSQPFFSSTDSGVSWGSGPAEPLQFSVFGTSLGEAVPEPSTWVLMLLGFAGLGFAGYQTSRRAAALSACR
jgi:hypothetical protein